LDSGHPEHTINNKLTYLSSAASRPPQQDGEPVPSAACWATSNSETGQATTRPAVQARACSLGLEFNSSPTGSPPDAGDPSAKLAARGDVWEGYFHYFFNKNFLMKLGYTYYDYSTAFSGWHIAPGPLSYYNLDNATAVNFYAFPKTVKDLYFGIEARW
jgi:hypothetical protein